MAKFNAEIMERVEEKEKEANYFSRCLGVHICPMCGGHLESHVTNGNLPDEIFKCSSCEFKHRQPWA